VIALALVVPTVSTTAMATLPSTPALLQGHRRRPADCCDADPDMCQRPTTPSARARVLDVIRREGATARACLTAAAPTATVQFEIGDDGAPRHVVVRERVPAEVRHCLQAAVGRWQVDGASSLTPLQRRVSFRFQQRASGR
jgi:hypothetical protein